ncbi:hypothetical protein I8752_22915 [Nostocaceae cyanobacterium CENA369]|uniref:Uncharacterized protein n=1 Tax=Dendronalium phyllosphericum CENA369 TaxID=1725256 RepID=A0A8J7I6J1_9NOST|nr:hypothetical protein [Dendronalium phyllosphericum]MBH8575800.1 hypothetical protein [Dendronalium phyllosphericum CENA369]
MTHKYESSTEFEARLDKMIQTQKLKPEYKSLLLEIAELGEKADANGLISGLGWSVDANNVVLDEYEIMNSSGNLLYLIISEARKYLENLIEDLG